MEHNNMIGLNENPSLPNRFESRKRKTGQSEADRQDEHEQKRAFEESTLVTDRANEQTQKGYCVEGNVTSQYPINFPNDFNNTISQAKDSTIISPNLLGNNISGDVTFNINAQRVSHSTPGNRDEILHNIKNEMKTIMKVDLRMILEGCGTKCVRLDKVYTELVMINDESDPINREHEIWQVEKAHHLNTSPQTVIHYNQILQSPEDRGETVKIVLTKGIAGIGKTVTVNKFVLDWANGRANQDLEFVFLLPFRELNLLEGETSLFDMLSDFYPGLRKAKEISEWICDCKVLFILDGLDEYKEPLNFQSHLLSSESKKATVDVILVNLLRGKLLPSAHLWVTTRPVTAEQLPSDIFRRGYKTQIRGFSDEQKEEYFRRQFHDPELSRKVIAHLKSQRSLWILCHIPLFSWISSYVLTDIIANQSQKLPSNQTEMYIHYLLIQTGLSHKKYQGEEFSQEDALEEHREQIRNLAELAYWKLRKQSAIFTKEDLKEYNITVDEAPQNPGVLTCISVYKCKFYNKTTLFSFVHLTVQEFFAALFAFHQFVLKKQDSLKLSTRKNKQNCNLSGFLKVVTDEALKSQNGHLDLFSCFLFGISCDSNTSRLEKVLPPFPGYSSPEHKKVIKYIKSLRRKNLSSERCISLIRCLLELEDESFLQDMHELERSQSKEPLTVFQCTLLAFHLMVAGEIHREFDLRKYNMPEEGFQRLSSALRYVRKALLKGSGLTAHHCETLSVYLKLPNTHLTDLDLSHNGLGGSALAHLTPALSDPNCQIQILNLSHNNLQSQDMELMRDVLSADNENLKVLDLGDNQLEDAGVELLSDGLRSANCRLEVLKLSGCQIKIGGIRQLLSSLEDRPPRLRELYLRYNNLEDPGLENLLAAWSSLRVFTEGTCSHQPGLYRYAVKLTLDPKTANEYLHLNEDHTSATRQKEKQELPDDAQRFDRCNQVLSQQRLPDRAFFTVNVIGQDVYVGVACKGMERKGASNKVCLGHNKMSWSLCCSKNECVAYHDQKCASVETQHIGRLGVFVDQEAGSICFYSLIPEFKLLYMFDADFPKDQDLHAAFRIMEPYSSVDLDENCTILA